MKTTTEALPFPFNLNLVFMWGALLLSACEAVPERSEDPYPQMLRSKTNFGEGWEFRREKDTAFPLGHWEEINLPHVVREEPLVVNDQWQGQSTYRKDFFVNKTEKEKWFFHFEGVMQEARVILNDSLVAVHKGGYLPFRVDATPFLKNNSSNRLEVAVRNVDDSTIPPGKPLKELDFNYYGGIYRDVYLVKTPLLHITEAVHADRVNNGGLLVHFSSVSKEKATGQVQTHIRNDSRKSRKFKVRLRLRRGNALQTVSSEETVLEPGEQVAVKKDLVVASPDLWSPKNPNLYHLQVELMEDGQVIDSRELRIGIRKIELRGDRFLLNGNDLFLNGTNRHQEYPYVGYAIPDRAHYRDAWKIKQAGFNFVRLSHYPQDPAFLRACDELGLIVMNCMPGWQYFGQEEFQQRALQDIRDMVRRDRNHPSVIFWENSLNESAMTPEFIVAANKVLKEELPYTDTYSAGWMDHPAYDVFTPARQHATPPFYWNEYDTPERPIIIAEYGDWEYYAQNAGFNQTAFEDLAPEERSSRQLRGAGEKRLLQQAFNFQEAFNSNLKGSQTIGMANWLMFDYNRGYSDDIEASGISDIFRLPKFSYYFYQSQKDPGTDPFSEPMVYIANYWTPSSTREITVFSNTEEVGLFLNGKLLAKEKPSSTEFSDALPHPPWRFNISEYEPGKLKAVGYISGEAVASHSVTTPGTPHKIALAADLSGQPLSPTDSDLIFIYAHILDLEGNPVPTAQSKVRFEILTSGRTAELVGANPVEGEAGIASILLRTEKFDKEIRIRASGPGLQPDEITLKTKADE